MNDAVPVRAQLPHRERLANVLAVAQGAISLNLGTFWAALRSGTRPGAGCLLGHYVMQKAPAHLKLVPLNFLEQVKTPLLAAQLFQKYPNREWRHHTLHYTGPEVEAGGPNAACLYFQLRPFDALRLFWPNGKSQALEVSSSLVTPMLERFLRTEEVINP